MSQTVLSLAACGKEVLDAYERTYDNHCTYYALPFLEHLRRNGFLNAGTYASLAASAVPLPAGVLTPVKPLVRDGVPISIREDWQYVPASIAMPAMRNMTGLWMFSALHCFLIGDFTSGTKPLAADALGCRVLSA